MRASSKDQWLGCRGLTCKWERPAKHDMQPWSFFQVHMSAALSKSEPTGAASMVLSHGAHQLDHAPHLQQRARLQRLQAAC